MPYPTGQQTSELDQLGERNIPTMGKAKKDPPLDELVDRLTDLMKELASSDAPVSKRLPAPLESHTEENAQALVSYTAEHERIENLAETLKRVEAAQAHTITDVRREIAQTFGQLVLALERAGDLSESSIQKLQVALGVASRESAERRILNEVAQLRADLQRRTQEAIDRGREIRAPLVVLGLVLFFVVGVVTGSLAAPLIASWLRWALGLVF